MDYTEQEVEGCLGCCLALLMLSPVVIIIGWVVLSILRELGV